MAKGVPFPSSLFFSVIFAGIALAMLSQIDFHEVWEELFLDAGGRFTPWKVISVQWWLQHLADSYSKNPSHTVIEFFLIVYIVNLWVGRRPYNPNKQRPLTAAEQNELISTWVSAPLAEISEKDMDIDLRPPPLLVESSAGPVIVADGVQYVNYASANYLGLADHRNLKMAAAHTIKKYGVGSCGPRGFYGTVDVHLELEDDIADFFNSEGCVLYSDALACVSSIIPAFAKAGDLIICDKGVHFFIQQGIKLSRSNILFFEHNDMNDLERVLESVAEQDALKPEKINRRFIIAEGLYLNYGDISNLPKLIELKNFYKYRLMLDDSHGIGTLSLRGSADFWGVPVREVDILCGGLDAAWGSIGGFAVGSAEVCAHQRLSSSGYCFSASGPPFTCTAGGAAIKLSMSEEYRITDLQDNAKLLRTKLREIPDVEIDGEEDEVQISPLIHLRLQKRSYRPHEQEDDLLQTVANMLREKYSIVVTMNRSLAKEWKLRPSLRIQVSSLHTEKQIDELCESLTKCLKSAIGMNMVRVKSEPDHIHHTRYNNGFVE